MRNIPTDLLRTFVTIIELRGFGRAGDRLGRTQPAISLQMKRLQELLGADLFARSGSLDLSEQGRIVAEHARRMLAINDGLLDELARCQSAGALKLGIPNDYADRFLAQLISRANTSRSGLTLDVVCDLSQRLLQGFAAGDYDMVVAETPAGTAGQAFMTWTEPLAWVGNSQAAPGRGPVRIVCYPDGCLYRRTMVTALSGGPGHEIVLTTPSFAGLRAAVAAGFGLTVLARRVVPEDLRVIGSDGMLPALPPLEAGLYLAERHWHQPAVRSLARTFSRLFDETV